MRAGRHGKTKQKVLLETGAEANNTTGLGQFNCEVGMKVFSGQTVQTVVVFA